jgi:hypothetical protein
MRESTTRADLESSTTSARLPGIMRLSLPAEVYRSPRRAYCDG